MEYPTRHLYFPRAFRPVCIPRKYKWILHGYSTRKGCITILCHAIENTVARWEGWVRYSWIALIDGKVGCDTVELHWSMGRFGGILTNTQRLSRIVIGCFFYGVVLSIFQGIEPPPKNDRRWFVLELVYLRGEKIISSHAHKTESWNSMRPKSKTISITDLSIWEFPLEVCLCCQTNEICFALSVRLVFRNVITCYYVKFIPKS